MEQLPNTKSKAPSLANIGASIKLSINNKTSKLKHTSGQMLPFVVITVAIVVTAILYVTSTTITDVETTTYEEDALRAFSAAEAGVEEALLTGQGAVGTIPETDTEYEAVFDTPLPTTNFVYPESIKSGELATFWFVDKTGTGQFTCDSTYCFSGPKIENICWGTKENASDYYIDGESEKNATPAIEIITYYDDSYRSVATPNNYENVKVARLVFDPDSQRANINGFWLATTDADGCTIAGEHFLFETSSIHFGTGNVAHGEHGFDMTEPGNCSNHLGCVLMVRVKMLYNDDSYGDPYPERVGISVHASGNTELAPQGTVIESTGTSGNATRKFEVFQGRSDPPSVFENAIFSYEDLSKL